MANRFLGEAAVTIDGKEWTLRCCFNAMAEFEEATGKDAMETFEAAEGSDPDVSVSDLRQMVRAMLLHHHPEATLRDAGNVLSHDVGAVQRAMSAAMPTASEVEDLGNGKKAGASAA